MRALLRKAQSSSALRSRAMRALSSTGEHPLNVRTEADGAPVNRYSFTMPRSAPRSHARSTFLVSTITPLTIAALASCSATTLETPLPDTDASIDATAETGADASSLIEAGDAGPSCAPPSSLCGASCVDERFDPQNCGSCKSQCPVGKLCSNGTCGVTCLGGSSQCGDRCTDLRDDPSNCGACGNACGLFNVCSNGVCTPIAPAPDGGVLAYCSVAPDLTLCNSTCVDVTSDISNCGTCNHYCTLPQMCVAGECTCTDSANPTFCSNQCTNTMTDNLNCGTCGAACLVNQVCNSGSCECAAGYTSCSSVCRDLAIEASNCGGCGGPCAAGNVCTTGVCSTASGSWQMAGSDAQHTGNNANEQGKPPMTDHWTTQVVLPINYQSALSPAVIENGRVYVTSVPTYGTPNSAILEAIDISDGTKIWTHIFPGSSGTPTGVYGMGYPSVVDGTVYVEELDWDESGHLDALDALTGSQRWSSPYQSQWSVAGAPLVVGSTVYIDGGDNGLWAYSTIDGSSVFSVTPLDQWSTWSPAFFNGAVYTFLSDHFRAHDPAVGGTLWTVTTAGGTPAYSANTSPVFGPSLGYVVSNPNLVAIDPSTQSIAWSAAGAYTGTPAYADGVVYGLSGGSLIARDAATGNLLWTFGGDAALGTSLFNQPVVANGYVYTSSGNNVYAVNIATHHSEWTAPVGGWLAIASGRLVVSSANGTLYGFVLTQ